MIRQHATVDNPSSNSAPASGDSLLKQRAYQQLKAKIQDGTYASGMFLSERQLASGLGMSKTPVKAALERLEAEGFISVSPQQGIVVRELTIHEVADHFEIREALETFVLRSVSGRLQSQQLERLQQNLDESQAAAEACDVPRSVELDAEFHLLGCEFLGNQVILGVMSQLREKIHRVVSFVSTHEPARLLSSVQEHVSIAEAMRQGEGELAAQRLVKHLEFGKQFLLSPRSRCNT